MLTLLEKVLLLAFAYVATVFGGSVCVRRVLDACGYRGSRESEIKSGALIGCLERAIMLTLILAGSLSSIGFVITAKSVTRFQKLAEDQGFAEYYLVGTLTSSLIALAVGCILRTIL